MPGWVSLMGRTGLDGAPAPVSCGAASLDAPPRTVYEEPGVVLYACASSAIAAELVLARSRRYAVEHRWEVVAEFADTTGVAPATRRRGFQRALHLIETGQAHGLVTRYRAMAAPTDDEYAQLTARLARFRAFLVATWEVQYR